MNEPTAVRGIPADEVTALWPRIEHLVERVLAHSDYTPDWVHGALRAEECQLFATWPDCETICITTIQRLPKRKALVLLWKVGRLTHDWRTLLAALENWGRTMGCHKIRIAGRHGWKRLLPDYRASLLLEKDL